MTTALVVTCGGPVSSVPSGTGPSASSPADATASPGVPVRTPGATPGVTPIPTPTADPSKWSALDLPPLVQVATLEATRAVAAGVLPDTGFRLASLSGADPAALAAHLTVDPPLNLRVTHSTDAFALLQPSAPLRLGQAYRVTLRSTDGLVEGAWAVQAVEPLHVATTIPGDASTRVPRDTGIEIIFDQDGVDLSEAKPFISFEPAVAGSFVQEGRSIAFAPAKPLKAATLYRVTVRHGLPLHGTTMTLESDVSFAFETAGGAVHRTRVTYQRTLEETVPSQAPVLTVRIDQDENDEEGSSPPIPGTVAMTVHRLAGLRAAIDAWAAIQAAPDWAEVSGTAPVATAGLTRILAADVRLQAFAPDNDWVRWFRVPEKLPAGWYVVTMTYEGVPRQAIVQVTTVAAYALITETRSVVWVNDLTTKRPTQGATASLLGTTLGRSTANGLVLADTPAAILQPKAGQDPAVVVVRAGPRAVFVPAGQMPCGKCDTGWGGPMASASSAWWTLFQPDRYQYRSTDTLNAWGVARDRKTQAPAGTVQVQLIASESDAGQAIATKAATPDASGAFMVRIAFSDLPYGDYRLVMRTGQTILAERSLTIGPILKPSWTLSLSTTKHAVVTGTRVTVQARAAFFEGTPVAGARVRITTDADYGEGAPTEPVTTVDSLGAATAQVALRNADEYSQWQVVGIDGRPEQPEEGEISAWTGVMVFRAKVLVRLVPTLDGTRLTVSGSVNDVAFSRYERAGITSLDEVDPYGAAVAGKRVRLQVVEHIPVRTRDGSVYDFVTKRVVPHYQYEDQTRELGTRTVTTNAKGAFRLSMPVTGKGRSYEVMATTTDAAGRVTGEQSWASERDPFGRSDSAFIEASGEAVDETSEYGVGDPIRITFTGGAGRTAASRYLWTVSQGGLRTWKITTAPRLSVPFRASYVPGVGINAVRFTGTGYEVAGNEYTAPYRATDRQLNVTITPDRKRYAPGGTATLSIRTTDAGGRPVAASVFIRVIDEKLYAMGIAAEEDALAGLYELVGSGVLGVGWTHQMPRLPDEGGGGDTTGGGGDARGDFRDWLVAKLVRTDSAGRASVTFDLSDDLTSWRATASAVSTSLKAGTGSAKLPVSLPFFAEVTVAPEYLAADRPVVRVRGFGGGLDAADSVTFTVSSDTLPLAAVTVRARAFLPAEVRLPKLSQGTHRIRVEAVTGSGADRQRDVLVRTFDVVTSRTVQSFTAMAPLTAATAVAGGTGLTTLVLSDAGRGRVVPILQELAWADPLRADRTLAGALAGRTLQDDFGLDEGALEAMQGDLSRFQADQGISVVPYASPDLELSALAALADDPRINRGSLGTWFRDQAGTTRERQLWVLVGRAATGQDTLRDVRAAATLTDLTVREQVVLALAALAAGDEALAGQLERTVLDQHGQRMGPWVRIATASPNDESLLTAWLAIVAASLADPVAADMDAFVSANAPRTGVVDLERALAARGWADRVPPSDASAVLTVDGRSSTLRIERSQPVAVVLTPAQVKSARLEPATGTVLVTTRAERPLDGASLTAPAGQRFTRSMRPGTTVDATDVVLVEFTVRTAGRESEGSWLVTDFAPSGLVPIPGGEGGYVDEATGEQLGIGPMRVVGQRVEFWVEYDEERPTATLRYAARVITPGTYRWEASVLQSPLIPERGSVIRPQTITINGLD